MFCGFRHGRDGDFATQNQPQFHRKGSFRYAKAMVIKMEQNRLDIMHRRYLAYLSSDLQEGQSQRVQELILDAERQGETLDSTLYGCEIHTDWLEHIEKALPFVERAVKENRQFIVRQGETVPIEKVRRVSKASVEHLAKHSELITREPEEGDDLMPEKLYMTENVSTFAVYENRFLYMLLCYVRDFTEIKLGAINELLHTFSAGAVFNKEINTKNRKISFTLNYSESSAGTPLMQIPEHTLDRLERIKGILASVDALLKTELMIEVSSAPLLKPPVTRTNVLLQNPCFAASVELFDYLNAYNGDGYEKTLIYEKSGALEDDSRKDFAELVAITSYLTYKHTGLDSELTERYRLREEEEQKKIRELERQRIEELKKKLEINDPEVAKYILALEDRCALSDRKIEELTLDSSAIQRAKEEMEKAQQMQLSARLELDRMREELRRAEQSEHTREEKHRREMESSARALALKDEEISRQEALHLEQMEQQGRRFRQEYNELEEKYRLSSARLRAIKLCAGDQALCGRGRGRGLYLKGCLFRP